MRRSTIAAFGARYDIAITTACSALNHFVVETTSGGQACVEFMRQHNLGVATFIILNKISGAAADMKRTWKQVPSTRRLFDLVKVPNERLRPAFYHALRNTLVARTLDDGMKVAYANGRVIHRVVSLDGQIIERNGTMSGGGSRVRSSSLYLSALSVPSNITAALPTRTDADGSADCLLSTPGLLYWLGHAPQSPHHTYSQAALGGGMKAQVYDAAAEQRLQEATAALQAASQRIADLRTQTAELKRQRRDYCKHNDKLQTMLEKLQIERQSLPQQLGGLEERHAALLESMKPMTQAEKKEEARLQAEAGRAEKACIKSRTKAEAVEAAIAGVKERIVNAGGAEMKQAKKAVADSQQALDDTLSEVSVRAGVQSHVRKPALRCVVLSRVALA